MPCKPKVQGGEGHGSRMEGVGVVKMGPTASLLILATVIGHGLDLLVGIDIDIEVDRASGVLGKVEIDD